MGFYDFFMIFLAYMLFLLYLCTLILRAYTLIMKFMYTREDEIQ